MNEINETGLKLCRLQAEIFVEGTSKEYCSYLYFVRRFMISKIAKRMDNGDLLFEFENAKQIYDEVNRDHFISKQNTKEYKKEDCYWMGYIYRYLTIKRNITSEQMYSAVKPKDLYKILKTIKKVIGKENLGDEQSALESVKLLSGFLR